MPLIKRYDTLASEIIIYEEALIENTEAEKENKTQIKEDDKSKEEIIKEFDSYDGFVSKWTAANKKEELIAEMAEQGIFIEALRQEVGNDLDAFDLICHVAFDMPPLTRKERAENVKKRNYFAKYGDQARKVIDGLLEKYIKDGVVSIEDTTVLKLKPLSEMGSPVELVRAFGKREDYEKAVKELEEELYKVS